MRLDFQVLWFENQMDEMRQSVAALARELKRHGMALQLDVQPDASNLDELAAHQECFHDYDLVLVDYDLGEGQKGDKVAKRIRESFGFTDIIFYSGVATDRLRDMVKDQAIDGVYCTSRTELRGKLIDHVGFVVQRLSRLEAVRGLAVVSAGRGDEHLRGIINLIHGMMDDAGQAGLLASIDDEVKRAKESADKQYGKVSGIGGRLGSRAVTSMVLFKVASATVEDISGKYPDLAPELVQLKRYLKEVIEPRNRLGHVVEEREQDGWAIRLPGGAAFTRQDVAKFRSDLAGHLENLVRLSGKLGKFG